jgi:hypothetical protein
VRDRHLGLAHVEIPGAPGGGTVEAQRGLAGLLPFHDDLAKMHPPPSGAERFHRRLLGREPAGEVLGEGVAMPPRLDLAGGIDPGEETISPPVERRGNAPDLDQIDSEQHRHAPGSSIPK